ncbi:hypothetical protein J7E98_00005, partial [Streptomyces sp. ISL-86]|nr:hypothetical protein [Streptomyces sp. ISL-86]
MATPQLLWGKYFQYDRDGEAVLLDPVTLESVLLDPGEVSDLAGVPPTATHLASIHRLTRVLWIENRREVPADHVSYTHLRAHVTDYYHVLSLLLVKNNKLTNYDLFIQN